VRCPPGGQCGQVLYYEAGAPGVEKPCLHRARQDGGDLQVGEFRYGHSLAVQPGPGLVAVGAVIGEGDDQDAGVNNYHGRHVPRLRRP
jgi:hypothetical protein